jgi:DNA-binding CsgD family transcriptional regulator
MTKFTAHELEVIAYLLKGLSNVEISKRLRISKDTVKFHLTNCYKKFGVKTRTQFIIKYFSLYGPSSFHG